MTHPANMQMKHSHRESSVGAGRHTFSPVHKHLKLLAVMGTTSPNSSNTTRWATPSGSTGVDSRTVRNTYCRPLEAVAGGTLSGATAGTEAAGAVMVAGAETAAGTGLGGETKTGALPNINDPVALGPAGFTAGSSGSHTDRLPSDVARDSPPVVDSHNGGGVAPTV
jgi:hypothetical protein